MQQFSIVFLYIPEIEQKETKKIMNNYSQKYIFIKIVYYVFNSIFYFYDMKM